MSWSVGGVARSARRPNLRPWLVAYLLTKHALRPSAAARSAIGDLLIEGNGERDALGLGKGTDIAVNEAEQVRAAHHRRLGAAEPRRQRGVGRDTISGAQHRLVGFGPVGSGP